jgi:16S rRNA (adenine1518-N6/adenine1519-N6)-dimethyltransferase
VKLIKARKSLGQNFLVDAGVSRKIVDSVAPRQTDLIIEIGPGTGALTELLVKESGHVVAVEIDARLIEDLQKRLDATNLTLIEADALEVSWIELISSGAAAFKDLTGAEARRVRVVANLPYYISTAIIERLIGARTKLFDMTLMLQDEVVERISSSPGRKEYGYLSVLVQFYSEARKLCAVPPDAFKPAPKVNSAVIHLAVRDKPIVKVVDERRFFSVVKAAFAQRRKTILNNIKAAAPMLGVSRSIAVCLERAGIDPRRRAETLTISEFASLDYALFEDSNDGSRQRSLLL